MSFIFTFINNIIILNYDVKINTSVRGIIAIMYVLGCTFLIGDN